MASVVTEHNFTAQISPVWLTLAFSLVEIRPYKVRFIFISGQMQLDFAADFFKPNKNWSVMQPGPKWKGFREI